MAKSLAQFLTGCDFGGFNSNRFDMPVLVEEFLRAGVASTSSGGGSSTYRTYFIKWSSARWLRPISSTAIRI